MSQTHGISNTQLLQATLTPIDRAATVKSASLTSLTGDGTSATGSASTTDLSGAGTLLAASNTDDVRTEKVAALKSAIDSGNYNVSAGDVADKLITHLLE